MLVRKACQRYINFFKAKLVKKNPLFLLNKIMICDYCATFSSFFNIVKTVMVVQKYNSESCPHMLRTYVLKSKLNNSLLSMIYRHSVISEQNIK